MCTRLTAVIWKCCENRSDIGTIQICRRICETIKFKLNESMQILTADIIVRCYPFELFGCL